MLRCSLCHALPVAALVTALWAAPAASTPSVPSAPSAARHFPAEVRYGHLRIEQLPMVRLNGQDIRTAPGFRLFAADNKLIFAHTVARHDLPVAYVIESSTQWLLTAWILTPQEQAQLPR